LQGWVGLAASFAVVALTAWQLGRMSTGREVGGAIASEVVSAHVRSLLADHLRDVASTDSHSVKPWFDKLWRGRPLLAPSRREEGDRCHLGGSVFRARGYPR
jgi:anti-sigma factor RsiW